MLNRRNFARLQAGFSMIELLVVMFLIAFMVAFLTITFVNSIRNGKIKAAKILLHKLDVALHDYYTQFNEYPPDSGYGLDKNKGMVAGVRLYDAGTLYRYLGQQVTWKKPTESGGFTDMGQFGPFVQHFTDKELIAYDDPVAGKSYMVCDPWQKEIGYIGSRGRVLHNRDGVDLFSAGPDRKTASDDSGFDHGWPTGCNHENQAYTDPKAPASPLLLGYAVLNGSLTAYKKDKKIGNSDKSKNEVLDDINNWDPE